MSLVDQALLTLTGWVRATIRLFLAVFGVVETYLRDLLTQLGVSARMQTVIILIVAFLLAAAVIRLFGGLFRILLLVLLVLLILRVLSPVYLPLLNM